MLWSTADKIQDIKPDLILVASSAPRIPKRPSHLTRRKFVFELDCKLCRRLTTVVSACDAASSSPTLPPRQRKKTSDATPYAFLFKCTDRMWLMWLELTAVAWKVMQKSVWRFHRENIISDNHCLSISIGHSLWYKWALWLQLGSFSGYRVFFRQSNFTSKNWYPSDNREEKPTTIMIQAILCC